MNLIFVTWSQVDVNPDVPMGGKHMTAGFCVGSLVEKSSQVLVIKLHRDKANLQSTGNLKAIY